MTTHFYTPCSKVFPRPCTLLADNYDGTFNVRPSGWSSGHKEIHGNQLFTRDEVKNVGGSKADYWEVKR